jgi:D-glycero-D-manno-heptose 1,7-bisphosphate phosphatase
VRRRAVFLDRDGTIIEDVGYPRDLEQIRLLPGAARAIQRLNATGFVPLVVTNQSGIARGIVSEEDYRRTERRLDELLAPFGAQIEGHYFCPHHPELSGPCEYRRPGTLLYRQAARQFDIDLEHSWWVGDRMRDLQPAQTFGARGILVLTGAGHQEETPAGTSTFFTARDLAQAVELIVQTR